MADSLSTAIQTSLTWVLQEDRPFSAVIDSSRLEYSESLANGTGTSQADRLWYDERTVGAASDDDLDLTDLSSTLFDNALTTSFARIKALLVVNLETTGPAVLQVGGAGAGGSAFSAPFGGDADAVVEVPHQSAMLLSNRPDGWAVSDATSDVLRVSNTSAAPITYRITIVGTSV